MSWEKWGACSKIHRLVLKRTSFCEDTDYDPAKLWKDDLVVAACKLPLAPARVLSIASRANVKSLHARWPIRMPTFRLRQLERHIPAAPIRTRELSSRLSGQRRIMARRCVTLHAHASRNITSKAVFSNIIFRPNYCVFGRRAIFSFASTKRHFNLSSLAALTVQKRGWGPDPTLHKIQGVLKIVIKGGKCRHR